MVVVTDMRARSWLWSGPAAWRGALVAAVVALTVTAFALGEPARVLATDAALGRLLRGMAALKALMALAAGAAVWWRLGRAVPFVYGAVYVASVATMAGVAAAIWQLSGLAVASVLFHAALLAAAVTALRDGMTTKGRPA